MKEITGIIILIIAFLVSTSTAYTQTRQERVGKVFEVKHKKPSELEKVLRPLISEGSTLAASDSMNTISVRDFPENIAVIGEAITRLDAPPPVSPIMESFELQLNVIFASMNPISTGEKQEMPKHLEHVISQLRSTLKYTNYRHAFTSLNRLVDEGSISSTGVFSSNIPETPIFYNYSVQDIKTEKKGNGTTGITIRLFKFGASVPIKQSNYNVQYKDTGLMTPLNLSVGETVVVGTTNISGIDEAAILIVTVKKLKE